MAVVIWLVPHEARVLDLLRLGVPGFDGGTPR